MTETIDLAAARAEAAEFAALQEAASPGPWVMRRPERERVPLDLAGPRFPVQAGEHDEELKAAARNTTLPATVEALCEEVERLRAVMKQAVEAPGRDWLPMQLLLAAALEGGGR